MKARDNPFRTDRIMQIRYRLDGTTWDDLLAHLERMGYRGAVIGPHGSGKTTLLEDIGGRLRERGLVTQWLRLDQENQSFSPGFLSRLFSEVNDRDILLFDGAEQLNSLAWQWFKRRASKAGGLIITTHQPGRLPTLHECRTSPELLVGIAAQLTETEAGLLGSAAATLFQKHGGNLRDALREYYDLMAEEGETRAIKSG